MRVYVGWKQLGSKRWILTERQKATKVGVCLSNDGSIVAIGALGNDEMEPTVAMCGYTCGMEAVGFKGVDIDGEAEGDISGTSVSQQTEVS